QRGQRGCTKGSPNSSSPNSAGIGSFRRAWADSKSCLRTCKRMPPIALDSSQSIRTRLPSANKQGIPADSSFPLARRASGMSRNCCKVTREGAVERSGSSMLLNGSYKAFRFYRLPCLRAKRSLHGERNGDLVSDGGSAAGGCSDGHRAVAGGSARNRRRSTAATSSTAARNREGRNTQERYYNHPFFRHVSAFAAAGRQHQDAH